MIPIVSVHFILLQTVSKADLTQVLRDVITFQTISVLNFRGDQEEHTRGFLRFNTREEAEQVLAMRHIVFLLPRFSKVSHSISFLFPRQDLRSEGKLEGL
jgi:hypothetical protein